MIWQCDRQPGQCNVLARGAALIRVAAEDGGLLLDAVDGDANDTAMQRAKVWTLGMAWGRGGNERMEG